MSDAFEGDPRFRELPRAKAVRRTLAMSEGSRSCLEELGLDLDDLTRLVDVAYSLQRLAADYDPPRVVEKMDVFHAVPFKAAAPSRGVWVKDHLSQWADFVREAPRFFAVGGAHYTMIKHDYVEDFANTLMIALRAREL